MDIDEIEQMSENRAKAGNPGQTERVVMRKEAGKELSSVRGEGRGWGLWRTFSKPNSPPTASAAGWPSLPHYQNCLLLTVAFSLSGGRYIPQISYDLYLLCPF